MNILSNICNPKDDHFQQQARTQAYKPLNDYVFQNRNMDKMRHKNQIANTNNPEEFKYQSWNHPYSISNFHMNPANTNLTNKQSMNGVNQQYHNYPAGEPSLRKQNGIKKISFKDIPYAICGIGKDGQQGEKYLPKQNFYSHLREQNNIYETNDYGYSSRNYYYKQGNQNQRKFGTRQQHDDSKVQYYDKIAHGRYHKNQNEQKLNPHQNSRMQQSHLMLSKELFQVKKQNKQLMRLIEEEYQPMKKLYKKLLEEQQEREYLVTKLEWKVKQLVKQMGGNSGHSGCLEQAQNKNQKQQNKLFNRVDSEIMIKEGIHSHVANYKMHSKGTPHFNSQDVGLINGVNYNTNTLNNQGSYLYGGFNQNKLNDNNLYKGNVSPQNMYTVQGEHQNKGSLQNLTTPYNFQQQPSGISHHFKPIKNYTNNQINSTMNSPNHNPISNPNIAVNYPYNNLSSTAFTYQSQLNSPQKVVQIHSGKVYN